MSNNPDPSPLIPRRQRKLQVPSDSRQQIVQLHSFYGTREIARRVKLSRKVVRRVLAEEGYLSTTPRPRAASKLEPFRSSIEAKVAKGLTVTRVLREIRLLGYTGGRSILAEAVRSLQSSLGLAVRRKNAPKRRFETPPGQEMQIDWSPYRLKIGGLTRVVFAFSCLLASSRKLWVHFYRDERQSTLLEALAAAFQYFAGCALQVVMDNMTTAILGRWAPDRQVVWHPRFLDFARHYGFQPVAAAVRHPDRKGKDEKAFRLVWDDFLNASEFQSLEELNSRALIWLDETPEVGNQRLHGTTRVVPNQAWLSERELLIRLPDKRFPVYEESVRRVDADCTISVSGTTYTVPPFLTGHAVAVHLFAEHFEVLDAHHRLQYSRRYVPEADKGKLIIDPIHYATLKGRHSSGGARRLQDAFLTRFPSLAPFVRGLQLRMKGLAPVHLHALLRLLDSYGEHAFLQAIGRAQDYRRFDARAVQRILEQHFPLPEQPPRAPLGGLGASVIGEVDPGSLSDYASLDSTQNNPSPRPAAGPPQEDSHGS